MRSLRSIMSIRWQDKISNLEVLERVESQSIESVLIKAQLRWTGHVVRMEDHRIPKQLLYGEVRYKDTPKSNLKWLCVKPRDLETLAAERETWRSLTYSGAAAFKKGRQHCPQAARDKCHRAALSQVFTQDHQCPTCGRCCASVFGLRSHMRSHRWGWRNRLSLHRTRWTTNRFFCGSSSPIICWKSCNTFKNQL